jgi:phosphoenolpyruvate carboxylase
MEGNKIVKNTKYYYSQPEWREKLLKRQREKVLCECGKRISRANLSKHIKTEKHEQLLLIKKNKVKYEDKIELLMNRINELSIIVQNKSLQ